MKMQCLVVALSAIIWMGSAPALAEDSAVETGQQSGSVQQCPKAASGQGKGMGAAAKSGTQSKMGMGQGLHSGRALAAGAPGRGTPSCPKSSMDVPFGGHQGKPGMKKPCGRPGLSKGPRGGPVDLMTPFHRWMWLLLAHRDQLGLTPQQLDELDEAITQHMKAAIECNARIRTLELAVKRGIRKDPVDLSEIKGLLKDLGETYGRLQTEGVSLYVKILGLLTPEQEKSALEILGDPFPPAWMKPEGRNCCPKKGCDRMRMKQGQPRAGSDSRGSIPKIP